MTREDDIRDAALILARWGPVELTFVQAFDSIVLALDTDMTPKEWAAIGPPVGKSLAVAVSVIRLKAAVARMFKRPY